MPSVDFLHKSYEINLLSGKVLIPYCHIITWCNSNVGRDQEVFVFKTLLNVIHFVCIQSRVSWKQRPQDLPPNDSELNWLGLGNWVSQVPFKSLYWANWPESWLTQCPNPYFRRSCFQDTRCNVVMSTCPLYKPNNITTFLCHDTYFVMLQVWTRFYGLYLASRLVEIQPKKFD